MDPVARIARKIENEFCIGFSFAFKRDVVARDLQCIRDRMSAALKNYRRP